MRNKSDTRQRDLGSWRTSIALVITAGIVIWAWITERGSAASFPASVIQAEGLLLTALVFAAGFAQQGLRRSLDESIAQARERERLILDRYASAGSSFSTGQLYEIADRRRADAHEATIVADTSRLELASTARRYRKLRQLDDARLRHMFAGEVYEKEQEWQSLKTLSGAVGHDVVSGGMRIGASSAFAALSYVELFVVAMIGLFCLGGIYAGWTLTISPDIEFWVGVAPIGLSLAYIRLIEADVQIQLTRFADQMSVLPLTLLCDTEIVVTLRSGRMWRELGQVAEVVKSEAMQSLWKSEVVWRLKRFESELPDLPWLHSLWGRMYLARALAEPVGRDVYPDSVISLATAERHLRLAAERLDDPVPLVALACCLEQKADRADTQVSWEAPYFIREASRIIRESAVVGTGRDRLAQPLARSGWAIIHEVLTQQQWYWPQDPDLRASLEDVLDTKVRTYMN